MDKLDSTQIEQLRAIGAYLYEIRQDQARSLEEIAAKTYIPLRLLKALEAGQEQALPEPVFVQGFIRRYGDALGLDGVALSQQFPVQRAVPVSSEVNTNTREFADSPQPSPQPTAVLDPPRPRRRSRSSSASHRPRPAFVPYLVAGAIGVFVLAGLVFILRQLSAHSPQPDAAQRPTLPDEDVPASPSAIASPSPVAQVSPSVSPSVAASPSVAVSPSVSPSPVKATPAKSNAPVAVSVSLTGDSWLQVQVDGEVEYEGILKKGTQRTWTADREVSIVAGNAGGVQVALNQEKAKAMGATGQVEEMTFTAKGASN